MASRDHNLADFTTTPRVLLLSLIALVIGGISTLVAWLLLWLISLFTNLAFFGRFSAAPVSPGHAHLGVWVILIPAVGGLAIGLLARFGSEKIRGHGIPEALEAILIGRSRLDLKVAILKPLSSAISIGTGGPFGAEGPIIMTGGAVGSLIAQCLHLSSAERKTLLVAGASAGMAAVFGTPVAATLLAVELLLFEWKPRSFIPVAMAAISATAARGPILGFGPTFPVHAHPILSAESLGFAVLVGIVAGFGSGLLTRLVYASEDLFQRLPFHWMWWPAIGGLCVGVGGYFEPQVLGVGYEIIEKLLNGQIVGAAVLGIFIGKAVVWSLSLGSGTSGGVLAPLLMMGGALGAWEARFIPVGDAGLWAMVSMAAMMGGTMRSPLTAIVFALELTYDIHSLPALMAATVAAQAVTVLVMKRSILTEKVARRGYHLTREYTVDPLDIHRVSEVMQTNFRGIREDVTVHELSDFNTPMGRVLFRQQGAPIVDEEGLLVGVITLGDVVRSLDADPTESRRADEAGSLEPVVAHADDLLRDTVSTMVQLDIGRLPVVDPDQPRKLVGYIDRRHVMKARMKWYEEENVREGRWNMDLARKGSATRKA
jgi:H+/Cl- antiporter ClcA